MFSNSRSAEAFISAAEIIRNGYEKSARATENLAQTISDEGKLNRRACDRVDISLADYENLKRRLDRAEQAERYWESIYVKMGLPKLTEAKVIQESLKVYTNISPLDFKKSVTVHFEIEEDGKAYLDRLDEIGARR